MSFQYQSVRAARMNWVKDSPTMALNKIAKQLAAEGKPVVNLTIGEPDMDTPENVKQAAIKAIQSGRTKYPMVQGDLDLRQAIQGKFKRENGLDYTMEEIIVCSGGKHIIFNAFMATLQDGDEVVIPNPYWTSYEDLVTLFAAKPVFVTTPKKNGFKLSPADLDAAITKKTKWVMINSCNNPTGAKYTKSELAAIGEVLKRHPHVLIITDDIYEHMSYDAEAFFTIAQVTPELKPRTLTLNGVSKAYRMTGWRIGYAGGPKELIADMATLQSQQITGASTISQAAAAEALSGPQDHVREQKEIYRRRRDFMVREINAIPGLDCPQPEGAFYVFIDCAAMIGQQRPDNNPVIKNDREFVEYLLQYVHVACVPGSFFGGGGGHFFRISYATADEKLAEACKRINKACADLLASSASSGVAGGGKMAAAAR
jgi:aspartate aminotransferase